MAHVPLGTDFETVAAGQTDQVLGPVGKIGDILARLIVTVATAATSAVSIKDGAAGASIPIVPAVTPVGVYAVEIGARSAAAGGWRITTAAGVTVVAVGRFA